MLTLGPFNLLDVIGEGGMGQIWHGRHERQNVDVALKMIHPDQVSGTLQTRLFRREVLAVASLSHHAIVGVYDYGVISADDERRSAGTLRKGDPFLIMEYASLGSLADHDRPRCWQELKTILLGVLDGLAHAHAHGLTHRDLKPGNVLLFDQDGSVQMKLADFGLVNIGTDREICVELESEYAGAGTPAYMAPEQIHGHWRDIGPWTDLYALGCMAFELVTGNIPFAKPTPIATCLAHLQREVPRLRPTMEIPPGFSAWVRKLLAKSRRDRFQTAADAAWALSRLDEQWESPPAPALNTGQAERTDVFAPTLPMEGSLTCLYTESTALYETPATELVETTPMQRAPDTESSADTGSEHFPDEPPPMPQSWQSPKVPGLTALSGVGRGLYGIRRIPLVGRQAERDRIWQTLQDIRSTAEPRALLLEGPMGCGKTALAEWLARRAIEVGGGHTCESAVSAYQG